jgi:hypothetical protein
MELKIYSVKDKMPDLINHCTDRSEPGHEIWESKPVVLFGKTNTGVNFAVVEPYWKDNQGIAEFTMESVRAEDGNYYDLDEVTVTHWAEIPNIEEDKDE